MRTLYQTIGYSFVSLVFFHAASIEAADNERVLNEDKTHVRVWNQFAEDVLALHKKLIREAHYKVKTTTGGYVHYPNFYTQKTYTDARTGRVISRIQWENRDLSRLHSIEVYVRDAKGRVIRDYAAAYLPQGRNAPVQTLINLHAYNQGQHAFRQFDASGDEIYEFCEGTFRGKKQTLRLFEDDIASTDRDARELVASPLYKACFGNIPTRVGKFIKPQ